MQLIRGGGYLRGSRGETIGLGLFDHWRRYLTLLWPEDDHHRWSDMLLNLLITERILVVMGSRDSGKTRGVSKWVVADYYLFKDETLTLMTSTNMRGLELRCWGDIKSLHERARRRYPWLPGNVNDSLHGIFTDDISQSNEIRDMRKGIICVPCIGTNGEYMGAALKDFCGIKQKRRRLAGDELQFIPVEYLKVLDSLDKGDFKGLFMGNPIANNGKALDAVAEPVGGWQSQRPVTTTTQWPNTYHGVTLNLVGTDSPNFDEETENRYPYLIDQSDVDRVAARPGGKDSVEWWSQIMGIRKAGAVSDRVLLEEDIEKFGGFGEAVWQGSELVKLYSIDAGFGGDPCVRTYGEFGKDTAGKDILLFGEQVIIPILVSQGQPEQQIARYAKSDCDALRVPYAHVFFDAGMYATLGVEMAKILSPEVNAVVCGGSATDRPVPDMYVYDERERRRRPKTWYEHVSKLVTEFWFAVRLLVYSGQARHFPRPAAAEFSRRVWVLVYGDRAELESKQDYKLRNNGESPNHGDSLAILVEGARRLGFVISNLRPEKTAVENEWFEEEAEKYRAAVRRTELKYR
jgi:hypothetical protein